MPRISTMTTLILNLADKLLVLNRRVSDLVAFIPFIFFHIDNCAESSSAEYDYYVEFEIRFIHLYNAQWIIFTY